MKFNLTLLLIMLVLMSCKNATEQEEKNPNYALSFNGQDGYVEIPRWAFNNLPTGTVELWLSASEYNRDFLYKETFNVSTISAMKIMFNGNIHCSHENFSSPNDVKSDIIVAKNTWYHIAWTWDRQNSNIYMNGVLDKSQPCTDGVADLIGEWFRLGQGDSNFAGKIDDLRIWAIARTQAQIASDMKNDLKGDESGLIGNWSFDEGSGDIVHDNSINSLHGTLEGGVTWVKR